MRKPDLRLEIKNGRVGVLKPVADAQLRFVYFSRSSISLNVLSDPDSKRLKLRPKSEVDCGVTGRSSCTALVFAYDLLSSIAASRMGEPNRRGFGAGSGHWIAREGGTFWGSGNAPAISAGHGSYRDSRSDSHAVSFRRVLLYVAQEDG